MIYCGVGYYLECTYFNIAEIIIIYYTKRFWGVTRLEVHCARSEYDIIIILRVNVIKIIITERY